LSARTGGFGRLGARRPPRRGRDRHPGVGTPLRGGSAWGARLGPPVRGRTSPTPRPRYAL